MAKTALILGGRGDIGTEIAARFESGGYRATKVGRDDFDLTDTRSIDEWLQQRSEPISCLVHSAGLNHPKRFSDLSDEDIETSFSANVAGFLHLTQRLIPELIDEKGRIVVLSSIFGFLSRVGRLPYTMSKHALVGVVKTLALELAGDGVLVNAVSPGYIDTRLTRANNDQAMIDNLSKAIPLGRLGTAREIAELVFFLGSSANSYITGQDFVADGGLSIDGGRI